MEAQHPAVDGSIVTISSRAADLSGPASSTGWAISRALMQAHPFTVHPPGYRDAVEEYARGANEIEIGARDEVDIADGSLQLAVVTVEVSPDGERVMTVGYWEGDTGSVSSALPGDEIALLAEVFETIDIRRTGRGVFIGAPVVATPRPPLVVKAVPEIGVLAIRPAISAVLEELPRARGRRTEHGEVFRTREDMRALTFIGRTSVVNINGDDQVEPEALLGLADDLEVDWTLRAA